MSDNPTNMPVMHPSEWPLGGRSTPLMWWIAVITGGITLATTLLYILGIKQVLLVQSIVAGLGVVIIILVPACLLCITTVTVSRELHRDFLALLQLTHLSPARLVAAHTIPMTAYVEHATGVLVGIIPGLIVALAHLWIVSTTKSCWGIPSCGRDETELVPIALASSAICVIWTVFVSLLISKVAGHAGLGLSFRWGNLAPYIAAAISALHFAVLSGIGLLILMEPKVAPLLALFLYIAIPIFIVTISDSLRDWVIQAAEWRFITEKQ